MYFCSNFFPEFQMPALHDFLNADDDIERLLEVPSAGENPNSRGGCNKTPLHDAVSKCERNPHKTDEIVLDVIKLINSGLNVNLEDDTGSTPLHLAVMCRNFKMIETLLKANADIDAINASAWTALHCATTRCCYRRDGGGFKFYDTELGVVKLLLRNNPDIDFPNCTGETPLMFAVQNNNYQIVRELLKKNAAVNIQDPFENSALHYAMDREEANVRVVAELARHGGSFNLINIFDKNPVDTYLEKLLSNPTLTEVENAKYVIKLLILNNYDFDNLGIQCINQIHRTNKDCNLVRFLNLCHMEVAKMHEKKLILDWTVYMVAYRLAFFRNHGNNYHIPYVVFDKLLNKLLRCKFSLYSDMIASGICRPYMNLKFAEMCCNIETGITIFEFDVLYSISKYLTNMEMLFIMFVCFKERPSTGLSLFRSLSRFSLSLTRNFF